MNIARNLERSAHFLPSRPAICEESVEINYAQLNERANRIATGLLKLGIKPDDTIALCTPNSGNWIAFYYGILKAGAIAVTISSLAKANELRGIIEDSRPKIIYACDDNADFLNEMRQPGVLEKIICPKGDFGLEEIVNLGDSSFRAVERGRDDTAAILFTGGTTGTPKGVLLSHENITAAIQNVIFNERSNQNDRVLCFLPFNHVFGQMHIMNATILSGGCLELLPCFDIERVLAITSAGRTTKFYAVPTVYIRLLSEPRLKEKLGGVTYCFSAATSMAEEIVRQWKGLTDLSIHEAYGMTESASMVTYNHYYHHVIGSVGTAVSGMELQIRDQNGNIMDKGEKGEICIRGRNIMKGYLNKNQETESSFWQDWFRSGDIGILDEEGYLYIVDRLKDMVITGGENVYPKEIEELLYTCEEVEECSVVGLPDPEWGEKVTAIIKPKPSINIDFKELKVKLKQNLSSYKVPKEYKTIEQFPKSPTGKILKRKLVEIFQKPKP